MRKHGKTRDDKLRAEISIYKTLMEDVGELADIFIGNEVLAEFIDSGEYQPFIMQISEFHFSPENEKLYTELISKIKMIEKKVYDLRHHIDSNHKKAQFIYRNA